MPHFTIRGLLALIVALAVGITALRNPTAFWSSASILIALAALCTASLATALRPAEERGPWLGFAIFGWAYFLLCLSPWGGEYGQGPARFLTYVANGLLLQVDPSLVEIPVAGQEVFAINTATGRSKDFFQGTFHAIASILFGSVGALVGRLLASRPGRTPPTGPVEQG